MTQELTHHGYPILKKRETRKGEWIILVQLPDSSFHPYVTWRMNTMGDTFLGDYCLTLEEAEQSYEERAL